jgi:LEA14-like dessication related protein
MKTALKIVVILLTTSLFIGCTGLGKPEVVRIENEWGEVNEDYTEVLTKIVVDNPNPVPIPISAVETELYLNGIKMGSGKNINSASIEPGESVIVLSTKIENDKIPEWWVSHIKNGERSKVTLKGYLVFDLKITQFRFPIEEESNIQTDILSSLSFTRDFGVGPAKITVSMKSSWGEVSSTTTQILHTATFTNPNSFPIPLLATDYTITLNNIEIGRGEIGDVTIKPNAKTTVTFTTYIENEKLKEWWVSHIRNSEKSIIRMNLAPEFEILGQKFKIPVVNVESEFSTSILS